MAVWIRPLAAHANTQNGTTYNTAFLGLKHASIPWTDGTQDLNICGSHLPPNTSALGAAWIDPYTLYAVTSIAGGASAQQKRIIRGDAVLTDPGVIHCGVFQEHERDGGATTGAWASVGSGTWRKRLHFDQNRSWGHAGADMPFTGVFEYDGNDYTWLQYVRSAAECSATAGSTFVQGTEGSIYCSLLGTSTIVVGEVVTGATSGAQGTVDLKSTYLRFNPTTWNFIAFRSNEALTGNLGGTGTAAGNLQHSQGIGQNGDWWYVHTTDGLTPANRVCRPTHGWNISQRPANTIWCGIKFTGFNGWIGGSDVNDNWNNDGIEIRRCTFDIFNSYACMTYPGKNRDIIIDRCDIAWGQNGIYQWSSNATVPPAGRDGQNFRVTRNYIHDIGVKERCTISGDNHALGWQNGDGLLVEDCVLERCGNTMTAWCGWSAYTTTRMKNIIYRYNISADAHDEGNFQFRAGYEITDQRWIYSTEGADCSGNKIEYCVSRQPTTDIGTNALSALCGLPANIVQVHHCYFQGGRRCLSTGGNRTLNMQYCTIKGPAEYFLYNVGNWWPPTITNYNTYIGSPSIADFYAAGVLYTFTSWKAAGWDTNSTRVT